MNQIANKKRATGHVLKVRVGTFAFIVHLHIANQYPISTSCQLSQSLTFVSRGQGHRVSHLLVLNRQDVYRYFTLDIYRQIFTLISRFGVSYRLYGVLGKVVVVINHSRADFRDSYTAEQIF